MTRLVLSFALVLLAVHDDSTKILAGPPENSPIVVTLALDELPITLDPHKAGDTISIAQCMHAYEGLLEYDPFQPGVLRPCLAQAMPTYDADEFVYTFKLRDDIRFADAPCFANGKGRKVVASDVVWSLKRLAALPDSGGYWTIEGKIAGLEAFHKMALQLSDDEAAWRKHLQRNVDGLQAPDDRTLVIKLIEPCPYILHMFAMCYSVVTPREAAIGKEFDRTPVGTGPFILHERTSERLTWKRNTNYRDVRLVGVPAESRMKAFEDSKLPLSDEVRYMIIETSEEQLDRFKAGTILTLAPGTDQFELLFDAAEMRKGSRGLKLLREEWRKRGLLVTDVDEPYLSYIAFNMQDPMVGSKAGDRGRAIRKATALAIDRRAGIETLLGWCGQPADRLIPAGIPGHDAAGAMANQKHNVAEGRKLLRDAGFKLVEENGEWKAIDPDSGKQVSFTVLLRRKDELAAKYGDWLAEMAGGTGIKLEYEMVSFSQWLKRSDEGEGQAFDSGWIMDYPDSQNMMQLLFGPYTEQGLNASRFSNDGYDKQYREFRMLDDNVPAERQRKRELLASMHKIVDEETPWVTLWFNRRLAVSHATFVSPPPDSFNSAAIKFVTISTPK